MTTNQKISMTKQLKNLRRLMINAKISATKQAKNRMARTYLATDMML